MISGDSVYRWRLQGPCAMTDLGSAGTCSATTECNRWCMGVQEKLVGSLGGVIRGQMALLGWPPSLTSAAAESAMSDHQPGPSWQGLEGADERVSPCPMCWWLPESVQ